MRKLRRKDWILLTVIALLLVWAFCPKKKPGHPVPVFEHDPNGTIHDASKELRRGDR